MTSPLLVMNIDLHWVRALKRFRTFQSESGGRGVTKYIPNFTYPGLFPCNPPDNMQCKFETTHQTVVICDQRCQPTFIMVYSPPSPLTTESRNFKGPRA